MGGAKVRWCSCNIFSTQDHAAAAIAKAGTATVFAWKGETLPEYWWCTEQMMTVPGEDGCDQVVDDGGDATLLIHKGKEYEEKFAKDGSLPDPASTDNAEFKCILELLKESIPADKTKYTRMAKKCGGVNLGCATGHPSFVMSCSFTNQVLAQLDLLKAKEKGYKNDVYLLPKELDEKVASLHLPALGAELTTLSKEQADYIGVKVDGPYKGDTYRY